MSYCVTNSRNTWFFYSPGFIVHELYYTLTVGTCNEFIQQVIWVSDIIDYTFQDQL